MNKRSDFPKVSADPYNLVVDHGLPLHRFKHENKNVKLLLETELVPRTSDYRPTPLPFRKLFKHSLNYVTETDSALKYCDKKLLLDIFVQDMHDKREFESYDPLKGNSLVVTDYLDEFELYIFSAGPSLSHLTLLTSPKSSYELGEYKIQLALNEMNIKETVNVYYPIQQIEISPLSTRDKIIIFIRTTSTIQILQLHKKLTSIHEFNLAKKSEIITDIDYSMPIHLEPSPFNEYHYLFITNNGYTAMMDGIKSIVLFEVLNPMPENINYSSRWRSCGFGKTPKTIYTASPECIKEYISRDQQIQTKILAAPNERIVAFKTSTANQLFYCFSTLDSMVVMDTLHSERPVITWLHKMRDSPPQHIIILPLKEYHWRVIGFSPCTQKVTMMHFYYNNDPTQVVTPKVQVLELHNLTLSANKSEAAYKRSDSINAAGIHFNRIELPNENEFFSITRVFEDGSLNLHYLILENEKLELKSIPTYKIISTNSTFDNILLELKKFMLPEDIPNQKYTNEVVNINTTHFQRYLKDILTGSKKLSDDLKLKVAYKIRELNSTTTMLDILNKVGLDYQDYSLEELQSFLEEIEVNEQVERARQIEIPGLFYTSQPKDIELNTKLKLAHEKKVQLLNLMIRPLKETKDTFQYIHSPNYTSTTTTKVLSHLWSIDNTTRYDSLLFPTLNTHQLVKNEVFPCLSIYNKTPASSLPSSPPPPSLRTKKRSLIVLSDDENQVEPKKQALSFQQQQQSSQPTRSTFAPISSSFAMTSTQPLPGPHASRTKTLKKKKKPKTSGFK